mmetsp:Transcript_92090/g.246969  ORF Transcript_92090/g.246969 Transcript_92090/m.246969 type:complete len:229 (+) Transcript_92090:646-1332(+)
MPPQSTDHTTSKKGMAGKGPRSLLHQRRMPRYRAYAGGTRPTRPQRWSRFQERWRSSCHMRTMSRHHMQSLPPARGPHGTKPWCLQPCTTRSDSPALVARRAQFKPCSKSETASLRRTSTSAHASRKGRQTTVLIPQNAATSGNTFLRTTPSGTVRPITVLAEIMLARQTALPIAAPTPCRASKAYMSTFKFSAATCWTFPKVRLDMVVEPEKKAPREPRAAESARKP